MNKQRSFYFASNENLRVSCWRLLFVDEFVVDVIVVPVVRFRFDDDVLSSLNVSSNGLYDWILHVISRLPIRSCVCRRSKYWIRILWATFWFVDDDDVSRRRTTLRMLTKSNEYIRIFVFLFYTSVECCGRISPCGSAIE